MQNNSTLGHLLNKIFGMRSKQTARLNEPSSRYLEFASPDAQLTFGRNCIPGDARVENNATPETTEIQYCRA